MCCHLDHWTMYTLLNHYYYCCMWLGKHRTQKAYFECMSAQTKTISNAMKDFKLRLWMKLWSLGLFILHRIVCFIYACFILWKPSNKPRILQAHGQSWMSFKFRVVYSKQVPKLDSCKRCQDCVCKQDKPDLVNLPRCFTITWVQSSLSLCAYM